MAKMTYGIYLDHAPHCYIISNADTEYAEDTMPESFTRPPIKMTILETEGDLAYVFSADDNPFNHPELIQGAMRAIHGDLPGWYLTGVNVAADGLYLIYSTEHEPVQDGDEWLSGGQICPYGNFKLMFEVDHADSMPVERYEVEHRKVPRPQAAEDDTWEVHVVRITEFIGTRKRRLLELRSDNHDQAFIPGKQYCLITEY